MPTATQVTVTQPDVNGVRRQALSSAGLQPSDAPTAGTVATAISRAGAWNGSWKGASDRLCK
jgi:hypothetical protein